MFSCLVAGRLPLTQGTPVDNTNLVFPIEDAQSVNHISVFMTGQEPLPQGYAATVHFLFPGESQSWQLLGCLKNTKPSAIFRLRGKAVPSSSVNSSTFFNSNPQSSDNSILGATTAAQSVTAMLGISVEPEQQVESQMNDLRFNGGNGMEVTGGSGPSSSTSKQPDLEMVLQIAPKIDAWQPTHDSTHVLFFHSLRFNPQAKNAYDYLSSFAPDSAPQTGPMLKKWLDSFQSKLKTQGVGILDKD